MMKPRELKDPPKMQSSTLTRRRKVSSALTCVDVTIVLDLAPIDGVDGDLNVVEGVKAK